MSKQAIVAAEVADADLDTILKKSQDQSWISLLPDELQILSTSFLPTRPLSSRSKAYIVLSAFCQRLREHAQKYKSSKSAQEADPTTEHIVNAFSPTIVSKLGETNEVEMLAGLTFLTALFQIEWQAASAILLQDGIYETLDDIPEIFDRVPSVCLALAHLLAQAAGHKPCRAVVSAQAVTWLERKARQKEDASARAAAAVALVKLNKGNIADAAADPLSSVSAESSSPVGTAGGGDDDLVKLMKGLVLDAPSSSPSSSIQDAVEGLAYMSANPYIKGLLASDEKFLTRLFAIVPKKKTLWSESSDDIGMTPLYGTVLIIATLCAYKPRLTEEETQIAKLRKLARATGGSKASSDKDEDDAESKLDDDEHVLARGRRLLKAGVMDALTSAVKASESRAVRLAVAKTLLSLIEDNSSRGKILQSGGGKALVTIIQGILSSSISADKSKKQPQLDVADLEPIQALAKLAITASPVQVFGPNAGAMYDAIRPFNLMLNHPSATLLQQFEAIMALTNLSSASPESADKVAHADGLLNKVELLMLEDHTLVRRASVELICNMIAGSDDVFNKYGGGEGEGPRRKLQILVAMCDVEDLPTRLAASGAVATVSISPVACKHLLELQKEKHRVLSILGQLIDPFIVPVPDQQSGVEEVENDDGTSASQRQAEEADPGLVHRGVIAIRNFFVAISEDKEAFKQVASEAKDTGIIQALTQVFKANSANRSSPVARSVAEALRCVLDSGVSIGK